MIKTENIAPGMAPAMALALAANFGSAGRWGDAFVALAKAQGGGSVQLSFRPHDVRRTGVYEQAGTAIPGARWCDPALVGQWGAELPADRAIVVYCVYGHEVGRATALRLRAMGRSARYLRGGIDGWQAAGRPLAPKGAAL